ncbi:Hypothetical predicted protein [Paramuricea clavata]|uniref:Uncharacterized protein n=1 Tax=Paramuricea clavata TaxID=317549 RepID=A0A7D9HSV5_PARCT|nr:Hypothetical predicted protein [Paramuricea clavata]
MGTREINCTRDIWDEVLDRVESKYLEHRLDDIYCLTTNFQQKSIEEKAKVCVETVKVWLKLFTKQEKKSFDNIYVQDLYWLNLFVTGNLHKHWENFFENNNYRHVDVSSKFPDDRVQRLVFHFVYDWETKFKIFFLDNEVQNQKKVDVLRKQLENILYINQRSLYGNRWRMFSLPDEILKQALLGDGATVILKRDDGEPLRTITGQTITASARQGTSKDSADGPKPDDLDKRLFKDVLEYAKKSNPNLNLASWTLVRAIFNYEDDGEKKEVRCYAFSGVSEDKRQIPAEWWKSAKCNNFYLEEDRDIFVPVVDENQLGPNLVMSIFSAWRPFYEEDLRKLTTYVAFDQLEEAESQILENRKDLDTLNYWEYHDIVVDVVEGYDERITKAVLNVLQLPYSVKCCGKLVQKLICGRKNQKFTSNQDGLNVAILEANLMGKANEADIPDSTKLLELTEKVVEISTEKLSKLEVELKKKPSSYLVDLGKKLKQAQCGEDNVLSFLSGKLIQNVETFLTTPVQFVALDQAHLDGKPFCPRCDRKVQFFSICPSILRSLGVSGNDDLLRKLQELFFQMNTTQNNV